jgi:two-component system, sensor histidine kinase and response regulator
VQEVAVGATRELGQLRDARVLLVEDNELNREVALGLLEQAHLSIDFAENGEVAVRMLSTHKYDVVLMDMQMPVMDGITATKIIRSNPQLRRLPIIAMTANVMATDREKCIEAGMNDHVAKPIDPDELFTVLLRWVEPRNGDRAQTDIAIPASSPLGPAADPVPETLTITGIDTKSALRRTGGNRLRYEALLRKFAQPSQGGVEEIRAALAAGDVSTAARAAHSLKGAAANLGAAELAEDAAKVEHAIVSEGNAEQTLHNLASSFMVVVEAIRSALPVERVTPIDATGSSDPGTVLQPLTRLKTLLKHDDGEAADFILEARPVLSKVLTETEIASLTDSVGNFDFEAALKSLSGIASRLSLTLE